MTLTELSLLLRSLEPQLHDGIFVYCVVPLESDVAALAPIATMREPEGVTVVLPEEQAIEAGLRIRFRAAWITLAVQSDLHAVGLTAAFATALGRAGVSCNVIAGTFHDHIFVPVEHAQRALAALRDLQRDAQHGGHVE